MILDTRVNKFVSQVSDRPFSDVFILETSVHTFTKDMFVNENIDAFL